MATAETSRDRSNGRAPSENGGGRSREDGGRRSPRRPVRELLRTTVSDLQDLVGRRVEGVSSLERTDDGWRVEVDVVELERIPDTTSVLATYEVEVDDEGNVLSYRRIRRYSRASTEDS